MESVPLMTESGLLDLPPGWRSDAVAGSVDLRVVSSGRKYTVAAAGILGLQAGLRAMTHWNGASLDSHVSAVANRRKAKVRF